MTRKQWRNLRHVARELRRAGTLPPAITRVESLSRAELRGLGPAGVLALSLAFTPWKGPPASILPRLHRVAEVARGKGDHPAMVWLDHAPRRVVRPLPG